MNHQSFSRRTDSVLQSRRRPLHTGHCRTGLVVSLFVLQLCVAAFASNPLSKKETLEAVLDSLILQKQAHRRAGRPIDELERHSKQIRDSISSLKQRIAHLARTSPDTLQHMNTEKGIGSFIPDTIFPPKNPFDWIVLALVAVAIASLLVLIAGLVGGRKKQKIAHKGARRQPCAHSPPAGSEQPRKATGPVRFKQNDTHTHSPAPEHQAPPRTRQQNDPSPATKYREPSAGHAPTQENGTGAEKKRDEDYDYKKIQGLRARIRNTDEATTPAMRPQNPNSSPSQPGETAQSSFLSTKQLILQSAQQGMNVQQISKKYHVSVDHVYLILKMAGKKPKNR